MIIMVKSDEDDNKNQQIFYLSGFNWDGTYLA